jgi:hypothetical protein
LDRGATCRPGGEGLDASRIYGPRRETHALSSSSPSTRQMSPTASACVAGQGGLRGTIWLSGKLRSVCRPWSGARSRPRRSRPLAHSHAASHGCICRRRSLRVETRLHACDRIRGACDDGWHRGPVEQGVIEVEQHGPGSDPPADPTASRVAINHDRMVTAPSCGWGGRVVQSQQAHVGRSGYCSSGRSP